jgi:hypothetical protein
MILPQVKRTRSILRQGSAASDRVRPCFLWQLDRRLSADEDSKILSTNNERLRDFRVLEPKPARRLSEANSRDWSVLS